jgi:ABC-type multidrug transport system fused ATPase/permease subunit
MKARPSAVIIVLEEEASTHKKVTKISRKTMKNPKIIILDEPTSALDSQSEKAITEAMHQLFKERTVLVIAHRLQTVKYADDIIVIDS